MLSCDVKFTKKVSPHPLVQLKPGGEAFTVLILQAKEPGFPQPDRLHYLNIRNRNTYIIVCLSVCLIACLVGDAQYTWSNSCLPVVLGRMANSSSASIVVTRTLICHRKKFTLRYSREDTHSSFSYATGEEYKGACRSTSG